MLLNGIRVLSIVVAAATVIRTAVGILVAGPKHMASLVGECRSGPGRRDNLEQSTGKGKSPTKGASRCKSTIAIGL